MWFINKIAEARIAEAIERGEFDDLPGAGKPLRLDDDRAIPDELRTAYRILKNAGCLPRELELRREIADIHGLIGGSVDAATRERGFHRINYLMAQLEAARGAPVDLRAEQIYYAKLMERLSLAPAHSDGPAAAPGGAVLSESPELGGAAKPPISGESG